MCFAPQQRALFRHVNVQKWSDAEVFTFWRGNVLRATTACTFLTSFIHFHLEACFAPQPPALFRHLNSKKRSEADVLCIFWLRNVLLATTACNSSSLIWPHGSAPAALASLLFDPPGPQTIGKTPWIATFLPFRAPASSHLGFFHLSILSEVFLLNFLQSSFICLNKPWLINQYWNH